MLWIDRINSSVEHKMVICVENVNSGVYNTENILDVAVEQLCHGQ